MTTMESQESSVGQTPSGATGGAVAPDRLPGTRLASVDLLAVAGLIVLLAFLWGRGRHVWFWLDEGISVGISSHPLSEIPALLRQDGSPPLYYVLLHLWMSILGRSD